jgi:PAS domain-containing protein
MAALQAREHFLTGILGGLESFLTIDRDWRITFANVAALKALGVDESELLGQDLREFTRTEFPKMALTPLELGVL